MRLEKLVFGIFCGRSRMIILYTEQQLGGPSTEGQGESPQMMRLQEVQVQVYGWCCELLWIQPFWQSIWALRENIVPGCKQKSDTLGVHWPTDLAIELTREGHSCSTCQTEKQLGKAWAHEKEQPVWPGLWTTLWSPWTTRDKNWPISIWRLWDW